VLESLTGRAASRNDLGTLDADHADMQDATRTRRTPTPTAGRLGWLLFAAAVLLFVPAVVLNLRRPQDADLAYTTGGLVLALAVLLFGWFGARIVARQPRHPIGWILCAFGLIAGISAFTSEYAIYGLRSQPGAVPGGAALAWVAAWMFPFYLALLAALLLLFPSGRPPSPRWRWVLWAAGLGNALAVVSLLTSWWPRRGLALLQPRGPQAGGLLGTLYNVGHWVASVAVLAAVASLVVRLRRARGVERQQLKWVVYAVVMAGCFTLLLEAPTLIDLPELAADLMYALLIALIPVPLGLAILRYRLYDIDRLINRTLVYGLLTALLAAIYAGAVLVLGQVFGGVGGDPPSLVVAAATLTVAALFQPARGRIQQVVDRRFNRRRYDAAKTVEAFSVRLREEVDLEALTAELLAVVHQTMQPTGVWLWLRPPPHGSSGAARGPLAPPLTADRA
jgi:MFS family permease